MPRTLTASLLALTLVAVPAAAQAKTYKRVAALTPFTANTLAELGVRPVAIGQTLGGQDRLDPRLKGVPTLALSHPSGPNLEQLAVRNPQLVLSAPIWKKGEAGMKRLGMKVAYSDPRSAHDLIDDTKTIGALVGKSSAAARLAARQQAAIRSASAGVRKHPTVLLIMGVGRTSYAMLANSWGGDIVRRAGGRLLTGGLTASGGYARISDEAVVQRNPDVIIAVPHGAPSSIPSLAKYLANKAGWKKTKAARHKKVFVATGNSLLQAYTDPGRIITDVRKKFLGN
ncbi:MAG TPA: ABC transporter substrate-binding protein [Baekduia sp.]|uniref:ABC transporter substrate-binding protein n=1 Tax=Baekduia sp. TaxID=2600305 RepID=UPI002D794BA2|nr:ABC transporter substrate-binding protein [Baekduia sp.]HET6506341.1 ABC transporter substrate-binding protein [Baekduia sp.]